jgi:nitroimidazol reductase NimA-like FMN-containing flavoprotein (pyridoxamine 5'-phosphate oxidase superfamily)
MSDGLYDGGLGLERPAAGARRVDRDEAMRLLASVEFGRVVFTVNALPAVRPVNHLVDDDRIIIRTRLGAAIATTVRSTEPRVVVAYEADHFNPAERTGWSVVVTGRAQTVTDEEEVARYEQLLRPWVNHADTVLAIQSDVVTGFRIVTD